MAANTESKGSIAPDRLAAVPILVNGLAFGPPPRGILVRKFDDFDFVEVVEAGIAAEAQRRPVPWRQR